MSDNYMDPLWQLQSCLLTCTRYTELLHALAANSSCLSLASTQFFKDNSPQVNAE